MELHIQSLLKAIGCQGYMCGGSWEGGGGVDKITVQMQLNHLAINFILILNINLNIILLMLMGKSLSYALFSLKQSCHIQ